MYYHKMHENNKDNFKAHNESLLKSVCVSWITNKKSRHTNNGISRATTRFGASQNS